MKDMTGEAVKAVLDSPALPGTKERGFPKYYGYPVYTATEVMCFRCGKAENMNKPQPSGFAPGRGAMRAHCEPCDIFTFFDLPEVQS